MIDKYSCGFVANTDPSSEPGTHWISIGIGLSNGRGDHNKILGEYFDSYWTDLPLVFRNYLENTLIDGNITNVSCKFGLTYAVITVYSTKAIEHVVIA